jgi:hypothetical protein
VAGGGEAVTDPAVREDGRCARPGCDNQISRTRDRYRYAGWHLEADPFCSTECCRTYYNVALRDLQPQKSSQSEPAGAASS